MWGTFSGRWTNEENICKRLTSDTSTPLTKEPVCLHYLSPPLHGPSGEVPDVCTFDFYRTSDDGSLSYRLILVRSSRDIIPWPKGFLVGQWPLVSLGNPEPKGISGVSYPWGKLPKTIFRVPTTTTLVTRVLNTVRKTWKISGIKTTKRYGNSDQLKIQSIHRKVFREFVKKSVYKSPWLTVGETFKSGHSHLWQRFKEVESGFCLLYVKVSKDEHGAVFRFPVLYLRPLTTKTITTREKRLVTPTPLTDLRF